jgi:hypothetical protein
MTGTNRGTDAGGGASAFGWSLPVRDAPPVPPPARTQGSLPAFVRGERRPASGHAIAFADDIAIRAGRPHADVRWSIEETTSGLLAAPAVAGISIHEVRTRRALARR